MNFKLKISRPTESGFYWVKCEGQLSGKSYLTIVKVYSTVPDGIPNTVFWEGSNFSLSDPCFISFAGPIPMPDGI